jgi:ElaB/YqjD/DUF883 family membrane-anchored ribosome-binding protein
MSQDLSRGTGFPAEMTRAAHPGESGWLGSVAEEAVEATSKFVHEQPVTAALWALGIGFVLGWRLKPW